MFIFKTKFNQCSFPLFTFKTMSHLKKSFPASQENKYRNKNKNKIKNKKNV